ncbi:hypothetical protein LZ32DRAFT_631504 [Colletotrichum eremochloae]|nr:hypothetical protein LZ32DRAFT_631504 [Colletotrichum eremochloae]
MQRDFSQRLDKMYASAQGPQGEQDSVWVCKFFAILALGEMYSTSLPSARGSGPSLVAGSDYFFTAVTLLQDLFEEPSIDQIETLLLFSFYSNALGRVRSAHMYSGMALRSSTALGLHRRVPDSSTLSALDQEHRCRLWWTVYIFDRSTCSKLGQPMAIQDSDIDVAMPSVGSLSAEELKSLGGSTDHLIAYINLARITGYIMNDIYVPSAVANGQAFVHNVRSILQKLRKWDSHVPARLRWDSAGGVPRSVASLQLHFNQCIILTTRPILLYVFKLRNPFAEKGNGAAGGPGNSGISSPTISDTVKSLADSCVAAARTSNAIISQLFVENSLATCGYFDAHHLFASTLVLIVSAISSPNAGDSDAVQTAFQLLMMMRDNGNAIAGEYFARLLNIQWSVNQLFTRAMATQEETPGPRDRGGEEGLTRLPNRVSSTDPMSAAVLEEYDWSKFLIPSNLAGSYDDEAGGVTADPLDNPLLQAFLDPANGGQDGGHHLSPEDIGFIL